MKPITNAIHLKSQLPTSQKENTFLVQSLPPVTSLKDKAKSNKEKQKGQEFLEIVKNKRLKNAEIILNKTNKKVEEKVVKNISRGFLFDTSVVEEWSPQHTTFKQSNLKKLYTQLDTECKNVRKLPEEGHHFKRHMPCHLTPMNNNVECTPKQVPSFLLGVTNSEEKLKHIPYHEFSTMSLHNTKPILKEELQSIGKPSYGWDEHVLSLISKSTADIIVKDFTTQNQQRLKIFLENRAKKKESEEKVNKDFDVDSFRECASPNSLENNLDKYETASTQSFLHELNKVKPSTKQYENILQQSYPLPPKQWSNVQSQNNNNGNNLKKGIRKWADYPKEVKEEELVLQDASTHNFLKARSEEIDLKSATKQRNNLNLLLAVDEWRSKWLLEKKWQMKTFEELKEAMNSINDHMRLAAVSAAGKVILDRRNDRSVYEDVLRMEEDEMIKEMKKLYEDKSSYVAIAAAITLFSIDRADQRATELLLDAVKHGAHSERWIAVQCLAEYGRHDDCVIVELLSHVRNDCDPLKRKKVEKFLSKLSNLTDSIQYMLSEQLNSTSWKDRFSACQILPVLSGTLRKDIANKLSHLTWHDWSKEVRMAAAVALGKTSNGKLVHDALCKYMKSPKTSQQIEALKTVCKLGIVTAQLMSPFLQCMKSNKDTVCLEAVKVARHVGLSGDDVINRLISLATSDRSLKIRAGAIKTLGFVGNTTRGVRDCLLWALHYEKRHQMREAACEAIQRIGLSDQEIISTMQDMLVVEENVNVKRKVVVALQSLGFGEGCDDEVMAAVRDRVKKLCEKDNMLLHVLADSKSELDMYLRQQQDKAEGDFAGFRTDDESDDGSDGVITRSFDTTLEAYRARNEKPPPVKLPTMQPPYIPYWTESNHSISFEKD